MNTRQEEFCRLFEPLRERIWRFTKAMVYRWDNNDEELAKDIMAETVLQAYERFESVRDTTAFLSFCFSIAHRVHRRTRLRQHLGFGSGATDHNDPVDDNANPEVSTDVRLMYEALDRLPVRMKEALVLFELSDLSLEEIQRIQGGSLSGVKSRVTRGRERLAALLGIRSSIPHNSSESDETSTSPHIGLSITV